MSKYHSKKVYCSKAETFFDSKKEHNRYHELKLLEQAKKITELRLQVPFELLAKYEINGKKRRGISYIADFVYIDIETGKYVVEDVKGMKTQVYKIKKKLFESKYGVEIREV